MSSYTVELRQLIQNGYDIGLKDYPIFDESYRETLNNKIITHYWMREIGAETAGLFKLYLNRTMGEIMPYYNQLYKSTQLDFVCDAPLVHGERSHEAQHNDSDSHRPSEFLEEIRSFTHTHDLVGRAEIGGHAALGVLHQYRKDHQNAGNEYQGNANRV